jgi:GNAT superfamily N-acetyltransferase
MIKYSIGNVRTDDQSKQCSYSAEMGFVCPIIYDDPSTSLRIVPYFDAPSCIRDSVTEALFNTFSNDIGGDVASLSGIREYIRTNWNSTDIMYVMTTLDVDAGAADDAEESVKKGDGETPKFVGCIATDRKNFYPCMSHLFVCPTLRCKGYGSMLIRHAEAYAGHMGFSELHLWCNDTHIPYYERMHFTIVPPNHQTSKTSKPPNHHMIKKLRPATSSSSSSQTGQNGNEIMNSLNTMTTDQIDNGVTTLAFSHV